MSKIDKIIIVGGGSSGWMTASILIKQFPNKEIIVIDPESGSPIGVGESTYDGIMDYIKYLEIDIKDFFKYTDASIKLAIQFSKFYNNKEGDRFIYPFGLADTSGTKWGLQDWLVKKYVEPNTLVQEYPESYFPAASLVKHKRFSENLNGTLGNFNSENYTALHFDALKFASWLKNRYAIPRGVKVFSSEIDNAFTNDLGIDYLLLKDGSKLSADLYVDCTGFKSLLLEGVLKEPFIDYTNVLPNNRAWATQIQYVEKEKELDCVTNCTALNNGWVWNIPLWSRIGTGYVYSDKYTTPENALLEFKNYLTSKDMTCPRTKEYVETLEFKDIEIKSGIHERLWVKNVVAIGLSAGFIEPLESNGLFTVHEFLFALVRSLLREKTSQWDIDMFNNKTRKVFDNFVDFIRLHYALSIRDDSEYWKDNFNRSYELSTHDINSLIYKIVESKTVSSDPPFFGGITWISSGMNYFMLDHVSSRLGEIRNHMDYSKELINFFDNLENKRMSWEYAALESKTMFQYLKDKYYQ